MRWRKLGKIFDPAQHRLPNDCFAFAQSPQALVLNDRVRVYFSTRAADGNGKFLSHIAFADFDPSLQRLLGVSNQEVIALGKLGTFDEHGIFPINVVRHGSRILGYTCGWSRRVAVSVETGIGLVESFDDGLTFQRPADGPVLSASLKEPCLVGDGFVLVVGDVFHMWYIYGTGWECYAPDAAPDRIYKIAHATSRDGVCWTKEEGRPIISDRLGTDECQALPTVVEIDGCYHMFFCYRHAYDFRTNKARGYQIGHAVSNDLREWSRDDDDLGIIGTSGDWDSDMLCYPHVFKSAGNVFLLYNGNEFGRHGFGAAVLERTP